jgi:hypothetical protein
MEVPYSSSSVFLLELYARLVIPIGILGVIIQNHESGSPALGGLIE